VKIAARMGLIALVIGTATAVAATGRLTLSLVVSGTLVWSFVPVFQLFTGLLLVTGANIGAARALEGYFRTHRAWSLWLLTCAVVTLLPAHSVWLVMVLAGSFLVPLVLTARALLAFCREDLGFSPDVSRRRVTLHQGATYVGVLLYLNFAVGLGPRLLKMLNL
jgi:hypothetical protein